jgi:hypothetical protein
MSVRQLAKEVKVSYQLVNFIETGRQPVTEDFIAKCEKLHDFGMLAHEINKDQLLHKTLETERFINSFSTTILRVLKFIIFFCLRGFIENKPGERGSRIKEDKQKDGLILFSPAFAWFTGGNFQKIVSGTEFIGYYPVFPEFITTSQVTDFIFYLFNEIAYDISGGNIICRNTVKEYRLSWNLLLLRSNIDFHPETWDLLLKLEGNK